MRVYQLLERVREENNVLTIHVYSKEDDEDRIVALVVGAIRFDLEPNNETHDANHHEVNRCCD
jgi:hypothetical protein